jgi:Thrombospondin type 3 repeat
MSGTATNLVDRCCVEYTNLADSVGSTVMTNRKRLFLATAFLGSPSSAALADCPFTSPTTVVSTPSTIQSWTFKSGELYWVEGVTGEFCSPTAVRRKQGGGGVATVTMFEESVQDCTFQPAHVRTDGAHVYFVDQSPANNQIYRVWIGPVGNPGAGSLEGPIVTASGGIGDLEVDDTHIWWVDSAGIKKKFKQPGGATSTYLADPEVVQIAMGTHPAGTIYWTEKLAGVSERIRSGSKPTAAGAVTIWTETTRITSLQVNSENPADDLAVYWGTNDGHLRRNNSSGTNLTTYCSPSISTPDCVTTATTVIRSIVVDNTNIYWVEDGTGVGTLRRVPVLGLSPTTMIPNLPIGISNLQADQEHIYYQSGSSSLSRVCKDAFNNLTDLAWWGMEVTQGIQDTANSVSLVRDKRTTVRAYPLSTTTNTLHVFAELHGSRGGMALLGSPLQHPPIAIRGGVTFKRDSIRIFSWELPPSWIDTAGVPVTFTIRLDPANSIVETNDSPPSNWISTDITFTAKAPLCGKLLPVVVEGDPVYFGPFESNFFDITDRFEALWPISDFLVFFGAAVFEKNDTPFDCSEGSKCGGRIIDSVHRSFRTSNPPDICVDLNARTHWIGMIRSSPPGKGRNPGESSFVSMRGGDPLSPEPPRGGTIMAEELGHNRTLDHVDCGNPGSPSVVYPYCFDVCTDPRLPPERAPCCAFDCDNGPNNHWGYDHLSDSMVDPFSTSDFMSYSQNWVSDWTWEFLFNDLDAAAPALTLMSAEQRLLARAAAAGYDPSILSDVAESTGPACTGATGSCCDAAGNGTPGCDDLACCEVVSACDPVCGVNWDQFCATTGFDGNQCGAQLLCGSCFQQSNDVLWLSGTVSETSSEGVIEFGARLPNGFLNADPITTAVTQASDSDSDANLVTVIVDMIGTAGQLLASQLADTPDDDDHELNAVRRFELIAPFADGTSKLRILVNGNLVTERHVSPNPPAVSMISPLSGTMFTTDLSVAFTGADPDNPTLHYIIQYSPNNGSRWTSLREVSANAGETVNITFPIDSYFLPGTDSSVAPGSGRVRVVASDGVNTAVAVSEPFIVAGRDPLAHISSPRDSQMYHHNSQIVLTGRGIDPEDLQVNSNNLSWSVSGIGFVGSGRRVILPGLPPGTHLITLTVIDSAQNSSMHEVTINVSEVVPETSDCCESNGTAGCDDSVCQAAVCACDPFCCDTAWDLACATTGFIEGCGAEILCGDTCTGTSSDVDNDGVPDSIDNCVFLANVGQEDGDSDGAGDVCDNCINISNPDQANGDGDSKGDVCDSNPLSNDDENDPDADGVYGIVDNCPDVANATQIDSDSDGVGNACDNCTNHSNSGQFDCDDDGIGDVCAVATGLSPDCNSNQTPDSCDLTLGNSFDADGDGAPDDCIAIIPSISDWGLFVLVLLLLVAATIIFVRRAKTIPSSTADSVRRA